MAQLRNWLSSRFIIWKYNNRISCASLRGVFRAKCNNTASVDICRCSWVVNMDICNRNTLSDSSGTADYRSDLSGISDISKTKTKLTSMKLTAKAFAPAAISSFFQIYDTEKGNPIADFEEMGAIGGGFGLEKGVLTTVTAEDASENSIAVFINSKLAKEAKTTRHVVETLLSETTAKYNI